MKPHRLAEYFPLLEGEEFEQLKQDIKDNGQLEPIVTIDGEILDGVNRWKAIQELKNEGVDIKPITKSFNGDNPLKYVISANIRRRHLTESQKGIIATEMLPELENARQQHRKDFATNRERDTEGKFVDQSASTDAHWGRATEEAAKEFGISMPTVVRAKRVKEQAPERIPDIMAGKTSLFTVDQELREARAAEKRDAKQDKIETRKREELPYEVKTYQDAIKEFKKELETAIKVAEYGKFSPEAMQFTLRRHDEIRDLMDDLEGVFNGQEEETY